MRLTVLFIFLTLSNISFAEEIWVFDGLPEYCNVPFLDKGESYNCGGAIITNIDNNLDESLHKHLYENSSRLFIFQKIKKIEYDEEELKSFKKEKSKDNQDDIIGKEEVKSTSYSTTTSKEELTSIYSNHYAKIINRNSFPDKRNYYVAIDSEGSNFSVSDTVNIPPNGYATFNSPLFFTKTYFKAGIFDVCADTNFERIGSDRSCGSVFVNN